MCVNGEKSGKYTSIRRMHVGKRKVERREKRATMSLFSFLDVRDAIFIFVGP
jgi:hypothetical protein